MIVPKEHHPLTQFSYFHKYSNWIPIQHTPETAKSHIQKNLTKNQRKNREILKRVSNVKYNYLLDGDREGQPSRKFRSLDDLLGDESPAAANTSASHHALPGRPCGLWRLDFEQYLPEKLLRHVCPATLTEPIAQLGPSRRRHILHHSLRPGHPHVLNYTPYWHLSSYNFYFFMHTQITLYIYIYITQNTDNNKVFFFFFLFSFWVLVGWIGFGRGGKEYYENESCFWEREARKRKILWEYLFVFFDFLKFFIQWMWFIN